MKVLILLMLISFLLIIGGWVFTSYSYFKKKRMSVAYGYLSVTYILHALVLTFLDLPNGFYIGFSLLWLGFHAIFRKLENISDKNDINKKEDNLL